MLQKHMKKVCILRPSGPKAPAPVQSPTIYEFVAPKTDPAPGCASSASHPPTQDDHDRTRSRPVPSKDESMGDDSTGEITRPHGLLPVKVPPAVSSGRPAMDSDVEETRAPPLPEDSLFRLLGASVNTPDSRPTDDYLDGREDMMDLLDLSDDGFGAFSESLSNLPQPAGDGEHPIRDSVETVGRISPVKHDFGNGFKVVDSESDAMWHW